MGAGVAVPPSGPGPPPAVTPGHPGSFWFPRRPPPGKPNGSGAGRGEGGRAEGAVTMATAVVMATAAQSTERS